MNIWSWKDNVFKPLQTSLKGRTCSLIWKDGRISSSYCAMRCQLIPTIQMLERDERCSASETHMPQGQSSPQDTDRLDLDLNSQTWDCVSRKNDKPVFGLELISNKQDQLHFGKQQCKTAHGSWKLSEVWCHECHYHPMGVFILLNHSQTSPLELITCTWSSQLGCGFPPERQESSA